MQTKKERAVKYLEEFVDSSVHYKIESRPRWYMLFLFGLGMVVIPFTLAFYNPYFAKSDKVFFNWMWPIYLGGTAALSLNIFLHDQHAEFCIPQLAQNHVLEMCMLLCIRSIWWTSIQAWSWSGSYWFLVPIIGGFTLEWFLYLAVLWNRHRRTCPYHNNKKSGPEGQSRRLKGFMFFLDIVWAVAQFMQAVVGILYDDELFT